MLRLQVIKEKNKGPSQFSMFLDITDLLLTRGLNITLFPLKFSFITVFVHNLLNVKTTREYDHKRVSQGHTLSIP